MLFSALTTGAATLISKAASAVGSLALLSFKPIKYFIDDNFRDKVVPLPGSVLYCDLWAMVEHSGIYAEDGQIVNIVVDGFAESEVCYSEASDFTQKSVLGKKIYVSCGDNGAVGHAAVAKGAKEHVGERAFYGLVFKNCHQFSQKCLAYTSREHNVGIFDRALGFLGLDVNLEPTVAMLKKEAGKKLGATKWRLWDWQNDERVQKEPEPDWEAINEAFKNQPLNPQSISQIKNELERLKEYEEEIKDENIPNHIQNRLTAFRQTLVDVTNKYEEAKEFLAECQGSGFSYSQLSKYKEDFTALARQMKNNARIKELAKKMGREYISEEKKKQTRIPKRSKSEVYGTHRSDDIMRLLPSELLNLEDETLEALFYSRLLEKNLMTYELGGATHQNIETKEFNSKKTGPVVACLDTSASMDGEPILKAKALLLTIAGILQKERRSLYVLLFGASGEIKEFSITTEQEMPQLLSFLGQGFGGGTDFETPLKRAFNIIELQQSYQKADILMISDGECSLSNDFIKIAQVKKLALECTIFTVLCANTNAKDVLSDEILKL